MSVGGADGAHRVLATSGTSGERLYVSFDEEEWHRTASWLEPVGRRAGMSAECPAQHPLLWALGRRTGARPARQPLRRRPRAPRPVAPRQFSTCWPTASGRPSARRRPTCVVSSRPRRKPSRPAALSLRFGFIGAEPAEESIRRNCWRGSRRSAGSSSMGSPKREDHRLRSLRSPNVPELEVNTGDFFGGARSGRRCAGRPRRSRRAHDHDAATRRSHAADSLPHARSRAGDRRPDRGADTPLANSRARRSFAEDRRGASLPVGDLGDSVGVAASDGRVAGRRARNGQDDELFIEAEASREVCHAVERAFRDRVGLSLTVARCPRARWGEAGKKHSVC